MDAIFHLAHQAGDPWKSLPERFGRPETVARFFRRLGLRAALNAPPWLLPDPLLSETLRRLPLNPNVPAEALRSLLRLSRNALGRASIPRSVRLAWA
ncbi:transposase [Roseomonas sp. ACRSG]|nr:transposase [Roseomonas sp. ACRSG]